MALSYRTRITAPIIQEPLTDSEVDNDAVQIQPFGLEYSYSDILTRSIKKTRGSSEYNKVVRQNQELNFINASDVNIDRNNNSFHNEEDDSQLGLVISLIQSLLKKPIYLLGLFLFMFVNRFTVLVLFFLKLWWESGSTLQDFIKAMGSNSHKPSKRTIKWTVENFFEEISKGFLTSLFFLDKSGEWRLVIRQKDSIEGLQTSFGIISTSLAQDIESVQIKAEFACENQAGHNISPGFVNFILEHKFAIPGDCVYSRPVVLTRSQLPKNILHVHCRIIFQSTERGYVTHTLSQLLGMEDVQQRNRNRMRSNNVKSIGSITPEFYSAPQRPRFSYQQQPLIKFIQHVETKTFSWHIGNFTQLLQNVECYGIFSPQFFINSHDFCSIWRLKLFEMQGVFRLHLQLRGLPRPLKHIKLWYLIQLVDGKGACIVPEDSVKRVKHPDYLSLWQNTRHILYRRDFLLERFLNHQHSNSLTIKISMQVQPENMELSTVDSDDWIIHN